MVTTLRILGDERLVAIDEQTRATLGIDESTPLSLSVERGRLIITPEVRELDQDSAEVPSANGHPPADGASTLSDEDVENAIKLIRRTHEPMLRKLAQ